MKYYWVFLWMLTLGCTVIHAQEKQVDYFPAWFFEHGADEYAGVSFPVKNKEVARQQAITAGLLSFMIQNELSGNSDIKINERGVVYANSENHYFYKELVFRSCVNVKYTLLNTVNNQYGECFVLLKASPSDNIKDSICISFVRESIKYGKDSINSIIQQRANNLLVQTPFFRGRIRLDEQFDSINVVLGFEQKETHKAEGDVWKWNYKFNEKRNTENKYLTVIPTYCMDVESIENVRNQRIRSCLGEAFWNSLLDDWIGCSNFWERDTKIEDYVSDIFSGKTRKATPIRFAIKDDELVIQQFKKK